MKRTIVNTLDTPQEVLSLGIVLQPGESVEIAAPAEPAEEPQAKTAKPTKPQVGTKGEK